MSIILLFISLSVLTSCEKEEAEQTDNLVQYGIPGQWKLDIRTINGITDLSVQCCDYIDFKTDSVPDDLKGEFKAFGVGYETNGVFELNIAEGTIEFMYDDNQVLYEIQISDNILTFSYSENSDSIVEQWGKEE